jgi:hypothetical protein
MTRSIERRARRWVLRELGRGGHEQRAAAPESADGIFLPREHKAMRAIFDHALATVFAIGAIVVLYLPLLRAI